MFDGLYEYCQLSAGGSVGRGTISLPRDNLNICLLSLFVTTYNFRGMQLIGLFCAIQYTKALNLFLTILLMTLTFCACI